jgi:superfamily II DNA/RNA helicase
MNYTREQPMKPEAKSEHLLNITRAKAKMWEYAVPVQYHIDIRESPEKLFPLSIALLGDVAAEINRGHENTNSFKALKDSLPFAANFFNSFYEARLLEKLSPNLRLLASAAFYLCDLPGNAMVLAQSIRHEDLSAETDGLNTLLLWILRSDIKSQLEPCDGNFKKYISSLPPQIIIFYQNGDSTEIEKQVKELRTQTYETGTDEQLLLGDLISAVISQKIKNATIRLLPMYSAVPVDDWLPALQKMSFIKEFWPAQRLLGENDVFRGKSAVVQMPTSAGKTKSIELILRSAFLFQRANLAIIIAPFRALCHEIKDSLKSAFQSEKVGVDMLSDILQNDFENDLSEWFGLNVNPQVLVVTPEKLLYVLRYHPELAVTLKIVIFDEGHQFDTGKRGITYELLITSLKRYIPPDAQKVLISAVIPNAVEIAQWLNGDNIVVQGGKLIPTEKSIGFASWRDTLGQVRYMEKETDTFFVPSVIESHELQKRGRERTMRIFPKKENGKDIALFLGLKLCRNGGVAIFCGRKDTAVNICKRLVEIVQRGYEINNLAQYSDTTELIALSNLCAENLGENSIETKSARMGVLAHHNNIPHGIRIAVEHAMREGKIRLVVCTSTLAQGVNLPIRYLIVTSFYQGKELIKVRDFNNLIGRAGRTGKHIEGSILFADPEVYDKKTNNNRNWGWKKAKNLLDADQAERIVSSLLEVFEPIHNNQQGHQRQVIPSEENMGSFVAFVNAYIENRIQELSSSISKKYNVNGFDFDTVYHQLFEKQQLLESVENFLLAHWDDTTSDYENQTEELARQTLAYHLADEKRKMQVIKVFQLLAANIALKIPESTRRKTFGKTLYGIHSSLKIEEWVNVHKHELLLLIDIKDFFEKIWDLFCDIIESSKVKGIFTKFDQPDSRKDILFAWLDGKSFVELLNILIQKNIHKIYGTQYHSFAVEDMVDLCENIFSFDGMLVVGAIIEFLNSSENVDQSIKERFQFFQKCLKYGLPTITAVIVYEIGFSDRVLAQKIAGLLNNNESNKDAVISFIRENTINISLPSYYQSLYDLLKQGEQ